MSALLRFDIEETLAKAAFPGAYDRHLQVVIVRVPRGEYCQYVVWNVDTRAGRGGRYNCSYYDPQYYSAFPTNRKMFDELPEEEQIKLFTAARMEAYREFVRRLNQYVSVTEEG